MRPGPLSFKDFKSGEKLLISNLMKISNIQKEAFETSPIFLATSYSDKPNVTITESGVVIDDKLLIADCGMSLAKENIDKNPEVSFVSFRKSEGGEYECYKGFGKARYFAKGEYLEIAKKRLKDEPYQPKGAVVIEIENIFKVE